MRFASIPTAWTSCVRASIATTEGSESTIPRPRTYTSVFAVPRSTAISRPPKPVRYEKKPIYRKDAQTREAKASVCTGGCACPPCARRLTLAGVFQHSDEFWHRKTDHIPEIAVDPVHQGGAFPLDRVSAGPAAPLARGQISVDLGRLERA